MSKQDHSQIYEMLSVLFLTVSKGEQVQQCIKEVLTSHPLFSPLPLFKYLSKDGSEIHKENLLTFLQENNEEVTEDEVKAIMQYEPGKIYWQYSEFLQAIYPFNSAVLREINNLHVKRYPKLQKYGVHQSTITAFLMLLTEQISLVRKLQVQKGDSILKISKQRLRKVLLSIKKAADRQPSHCENDDTRITSLQLRNFMKAFVSVQDIHFLYLSRKLGIKNGSFRLQTLEKFIKPRNLHNKQINKEKHYQRPAGKYPQRQLQDQRGFDQKSYKQEIYEELAQSLHLKKSRKKGLKEKDTNIPHQYSKRQKDNDISFEQGKQNLSSNRFQQSENYFLEKPKEQVRNSSPRQLLLKFIQLFLPAARQLEQLKIKVAQHKVDFLRLFKRIDKSHRGVVSAQDLYEFYVNAGGLLQITSKQFELIIQRYGQSEQPWLSFAQFCEMVRAQDKQAQNQNLATFGQDVEELILSIIELSVKSQLSILKIRRQFRKHQSKYLFNLINREQTGFINYQELKKFLIEAGLHLSMHDLMSVLKRLDRSRNGVIVQHQFVSYFQSPSGY